jgi:tRNA uridine 5-carbamoylmethylation protein Kti12
MSNPEIARRGAQLAREALEKALAQVQEQERETQEFICEVISQERRALEKVLAELEPLREQEIETLLKFQSEGE